MTTLMKNDFELAKYCIGEAAGRPHDVAPHTMLQELDDWDSLDRACLAVQLGKMLDTSIEDTEVEQWVTVADVMDTIEAHRKP
jgi:acyl carrier protein